MINFSANLLYKSPFLEDKAMSWHTLQLVTFGRKSAVEISH